MSTNAELDSTYHRVYSAADTTEDESDEGSGIDTLDIYRPPGLPGIHTQLEINYQQRKERQRLGSQQNLGRRYLWPAVIYFLTIFLSMF